MPNDVLPGHGREEQLRCAEDIVVRPCTRESTGRSSSWAASIPNDNVTAQGHFETSIVDTPEPSCGSILRTHAPCSCRDGTQYESKAIATQLRTGGGRGVRVHVGMFLLLEVFVSVWHTQEPFPNAVLGLQDSSQEANRCPHPQHTSWSGRPRRPSARRRPPSWRGDA